jgi:SAM-dependent methyltransferase
MMGTPRRSPQPRYFDGTRSDLLDWLGGRYPSVLEIGCGRGGNADWFRRHGADRIVGIELDSPSAEVAKTRFDLVMVGDVNDRIGDLDSPFDLIVCADVLEHLEDPWAVVTRLRTVAAPGATIVASIPNIRFYRALLEIAFGRGFRYESEGIFDRTHLRFFTRRTIQDLMVQGGWTVERLEPSATRRFGSLRRGLDGLTARRLREWSTYQWYVEARASRDATPARERNDR